MMTPFTPFPTQQPSFGPFGGPTIPFGFGGVPTPWSTGGFNGFGGPTSTFGFNGFNGFGQSPSGGPITPQFNAWGGVPGFGGQTSGWFNTTPYGGTNWFNNPWSMVNTPTTPFGFPVNPVNPINWGGFNTPMNTGWMNSPFFGAFNPMFSMFGWPTFNTGGGNGQTGEPNGKPQNIPFGFPGFPYGFNPMTPNGMPTENVTKAA